MTEVYSFHRDWHIVKEGVRVLDSEEREGFACNTSQCPLSADFGMKAADGTDVSDVRCEDCAEAIEWTKEVIKDE